MAVVSISIPDALLAQADRFIRERGVGGRSELARAALRDFLLREGAAERAGHRTATIALSYAEGAERRIAGIRHEHTDVIQAMMHSHTGRSCVEVFVVAGDARRLRSLVTALQGERDTRLVSVTYTDVAEPAEAPRGAHRH